MRPIAMEWDAIMAACLSAKQAFRISGLDGFFSPYQQRCQQKGKWCAPLAISDRGARAVAYLPIIPNHPPTDCLMAGASRSGGGHVLARWL